MSVSSFRSSGLGRNRKQGGKNSPARQKARRPLARKAFFESLEGRAMMAFVAAAGSPFTSGVGEALSVAIGDFNNDGHPDVAVANGSSNNTVSILLGSGTGAFSAPTNFVAGTRPFSVATGDFNGDGKLDLATANIDSNNVSVLLGTGTGSFGAATNFAVGSSPRTVAIGDVNGDGKLDLALANALSNDVSVLLGSGSGSFGAATNFAAGSAPQSVALGDLNSDGKLDIAVTNTVGSTVSVLLGTGSGAFGAAVSFGTGGLPLYVAIGDVNTDGKLDLVTANTSDNTVGVLLGTGTGSFGAATSFGVGSTSPLSVAIGDVNDDGKPDLAVANTSGGNISILLGNGAGAFGGATTFVAPDSRILAMADLNGDGRPDIVSGNVSGQSVNVLLNTYPAVTGLPFQSATNFAGGAAAYSVSGGDFNGDGKPDLAVVNRDSDNVSVLLGTGTGSFGAATNFPVGASPRSVTVGDFNGDGKPDLAVANTNSDNVSVLLGTGTGSFNAATDFAVGTNPESVVSGDFNGDGKLDLAAANLNANNVSVLLGTGTGSFGAPANFAVGTNPDSVMAGDFNRDGKLDLAVANLSSGNVSVLLGSGTGSFGAATNFAVGTFPRSVAVDDFNEDGKIDLATANDGSNNVSVLLGTGTGSFGAATNFAVGARPFSVTVGDFDGDGKLDLATANNTPNNVSVLLGTGTGTFGAATDFGVGTNPQSVTVGDFNVDGKTDLATANFTSNDISVLLGGPPTGTLSATLVGGNLVVTDTDAAGKNNNLTVEVSGGFITVKEASEKFSSAPAGWTLSADGKSISIPEGTFSGQISINAGGGDDKLTVKAAALVNRVNYDGGVNGNDTLSYDADSAPDLHLNYADTFTATDKAGTITDGANIKVSYSNLTPVTVTNVAGALTFTLPAVTDPDAVISFDGTNIVLTGSSFETTTVSLAAITSVTVNGNGGDDNITVDATYFTPQPPLDINTAGGKDTITLNGVANNVSTGAGDDVIVVNTGRAAAIDGGADNNTLNLTAVGATAVTVNAVSGTGASGTETTRSINFSSITKLVADGTGSLTGPNAANTWEIDDGGTNTLNTNLTFAGFKTLTGGDAVDTFNVRNNTAVSYTLNGGKGLDKFNLGSVANKLDSIANIAVNGGLDGADLTLNDQGNSTNLDYTLTATTIGRTAGAAATFTGLTNITLNAGSGNNKLTISGMPSLANVSSSMAFNLSTGTDTMDLTGVNPAGVALGAPAADPTGFNGNLSAGGPLSAFSGVEVINAKAGTAGDQLTGIDVDSTWTINEAATNTYVRNSEPARNLTFTGMDVLQGRTQVDTFNVLNNSATSTYSLKGGGGLDAFNFGNANSLANITNPISVDGETAGATLTLNDQGTATNVNYSISATTMGRAGGGAVTFGNITDLTLNATNGTNKLSVTAAPTATGTRTLNGGSGADTLDLTGAGVSAVTITNDNATSGFDGNFSGVNFTGIESFLGLTGSTFTGDDVDSTWTINNPAASTYATAARTANITGFDVLQGGSGKDTFNVVNNSTTANYSLKGGAGLDVFNFGSANKLDGVTNPVSVDGEAAGATLALNDQANVTPFNYTAGATTIGRVGGGTVTYGNITDLTLNASNGNNIITVTGMPTATGAITLNGGTGDDELDLSAVNPVTVSQLAFTALPSTTGFNGKVASGAASFNFTGVEAIDADGATAGDTLIGMDAASTWTIDESVGNSSKYVNNASPARPLRFTGFDTLQGGTAVDTYNVLDNSLTSTFSLKGGASLDAFNFGNGNNLVGITNPISVDGEVASATLTLNDQGHANPINYTVGTNTIGRTGSGTVTYSNITALTLNASNGANKISVTGMPTASGPITLNGGTGNDTLDLTSAALNPVKVTLTAATAPLLTATGFDGNVSSGGKSFNFTAVEKADAPSGLGDELVGINIDATWTINDATGSSYLADLALPNPDRKLDWSGFELLTGNSGKDTYKVQNNGASNPLTLDGKAGADTFLIADGSNKLRPSSVIKSLSVIGNADAGDQLIVNDQDEAGDKDYSISATAVTALEPGGVVVSHNTVETIILNASDGKNKITVFDGGYAPSTTIKLVDPVGASELTVDDTADTSGNTWSVTSSQVIRTAPTPILTVDYSNETTITKLSLLGGKSVDDISVISTKANVATLVSGGLENDKITVTPAGNLNTLAGPLTVDGGDHNLLDTRTVFKGGTKDSPTVYKFTAKSSSVAKGDTLIINDSTQPGFTKYSLNNTTVSRTSATPINVSYANVELLKLQAGSAESDITANMPLPTDPTQLPTVVQIDGGNAASDNRFQVKGSTGADDITIGDVTANEASRSQFEVTSIKRMWVEGNVGNDTIHNRTAAVPALLDGGRAKDATTTPALANSAVTNEDDVIISDAQSNAALSSVLLGNDGKDFLLTRNNGSNGVNPPGLPASTSILIGDYFINNNVPFTSSNVAQRTNRLQVVINPALPASSALKFGESGDRYVTEQTVAAPRNRAIARLDDAPNTYGPGRFENLSVDVTNMTVIQWLQGKLRITISPQGIANELAVANYYVRQFTREPTSPTSQSPAYPNQTYRPGGVASGGSANGGEFVDGSDGSTGDDAALVQNPFDAADVNGDGKITAFDALLVINELNLHGPHMLDTAATGGDAPTTSSLLDVTGDSAVTAFDALVIINRLNLGDTTARNPDALGTYFRQLDEAEIASNEAAATEWATNPPANSWSDDALLALLASDGDSSSNQFGL